MKKSIVKSLIAITELYLLQFIVLPFLGFPDEDMSFAWGLFVLYSVVTVVFISEKLLPVLLSDILYFILVFMYHPRGAYGIGMYSPGILSVGYLVYWKEAVPFDIMVRTVYLLIVQIFVWVLFLLYKFVRSKKTQKKQN